MITLAIDTSTPHGSVAVLRDADVILDRPFLADRSHSSSLFTTLDEVLGELKSLDQIAVGLGPGSFAGIRISIAAALGLQLAKGAELVGLPSAAGLPVDAAEYAVIGDARRDAFYFTRVRDGVCLDGPRLLGEAGLRETLASCPGIPVFTSAPLPAFPNATVSFPSAAILGRHAAGQRGITARGDLEPIYLRDPHITRPKARASGNQP